MRFACQKMAVLLILIISLAGCMAHNLRDGIASFHAQDYRAAFIRLKPEALRGQVDAQYAIGYMYYYGEGVVENKKKALFWIAKAAAAGHPGAITALALLEKHPRDLV